MISAVNCLRF